MAVLFCLSTPAFALDAPTGVNASKGTYADRVEVTWSSVSGATYYEVLRGPAWDYDPAHASVLGTPTGTTYTDTPPTVNEYYYYWVRARTSSTSSSLSAYSLGFRAIPDIPAPTGVNATDGTYLDHVRITWNTVSIADKYGVYRATSPTNTKSFLGYTTNTYLDDYTLSYGTTYYYFVVAYLGGDSSEYSSYNTGYKSAALGVPTGVNATDGTYTDRIRITWNAVGGALEYEVWRRRNDQPLIPMDHLTTTTSTSYDDMENDPPYADVIYDYRIRATNGAETSAYSNAESGHIAPPAPSTPWGLAASDGTYADKIRLTWNPIAYAHAYWLYRATSSTGTKIKIAEITSTSYDDTGITPGVPYFYWVRAWNETALSNYSSWNSGYAPLPVPLNVSASDGAYLDKIRITWSSVSAATEYEVYRATSPTGTKTRLTTIASTLYDDTSASAGTPYYYFISARNATLSSAYSAYDAGERATALSPPGNVRASDGTYEDKIRITWDSVSGATRYLVYRAASLTGTRSQIGTATTTTFDDTDASLLVETTYYYWVKAESSTQTSGYSNYNTGFLAAPPLPVPTGVQASDGTHPDHVHITWTPASGISGYEVYRSTSSGGTKYFQATVTTASYDDYAVQYGTTYWYWIRTRLGGATSEFGASDSGYKGAALQPPSNVSATDGTLADRVRITWSSALGATEYKIYRATSTVTTRTLLATVSALAYDDTSAQPGIRYYYWVKSKNSVEETTYSSYNTGSRAFPPPSGLTASQGEHAGLVRLQWQAVSGALRYIIMRATSADAAPEELATVESLQYDDTAVVSGTVYYYTVKAESNSLLSAPCDVVSGYPKGVAPAAPATLSASRGDYADRVYLAWTAVESATGYEIYRQHPDADASVKLATAEDNQYTDTAAEPDIQYLYQVRAMNAFGTSPLTAPILGWAATQDGTEITEVALGTAFTLAVVPGEGSGTREADGSITFQGKVLLNDLLLMDGSVRVDGLQVQASARLSVRLGAREIPLYTAPVTCSFDAAEAAVTLANRALSALTVGGVAVEIGSIRLPVEDRGGLRLSGSLLVDLRTINVELNLSESAGNFVWITADGEVELVGEVSLEGDLKLGSNLQLKRLAVRFNTIDKIMEGAASLTLPGLTIENLIVGVRDGRINRLGLELGSLHKPIGTTGLFLETLRFEAQNLATDGALSLLGGGTATLGPMVEIDGDSLALAGFDGNVTIFSDGILKLDGGTFLLKEDWQIAGADITCDPHRNRVSLDGRLLLGEVFTGHLHADITSSKLDGCGQGALRIPPGYPLGGRTIADGVVVLRASREDSGASSWLVAAGGHVPVRDKIPSDRLIRMFGTQAEALLQKIPEPSVGMRLTRTNGAWGWDVISYDAVTTTSRMSRIARLAGGRKALQESETVTLPGNGQLAILCANWQTGDARFTLRTPEGEEITPETDADNIYYAPLPSGLGADYYIANPSGGEWQMQVTAETDAGTVTFCAMEPDTPQQIQLLSPTGLVDITGSPLSIAWQAENVSDSATVELYLDTDTRGLDGIRITPQPVAASAGSYQWTPQGIPDGIYYVYALLHDTLPFPTYAYSPGVVSIRGLAQEGADLPAPDGVTASWTDNRLAVRWSAVAGTSVEGYRVYYRPADGQPDAAAYVSTGTETAVTLTDADPAQGYVVAVAAMTADSLCGARSPYLLVAASNASANRPPYFRAHPQTATAYATLYRSRLDAVDPDGDTLSYSVANPPRGLSIDAATGELTWTPDASQIGLHFIDLLVQDSAGQRGTTLTAAITVYETASANPITFVNTPPAIGIVGIEYSANLAATHSQGTALSYTLLVAPDTAEIDDTGAFSWTPGSADVGTHAVYVEASDTQGNRQAFAFSVMVVQRETEANGNDGTTSTSTWSASFGFNKSPAYYKVGERLRCTLSLSTYGSNTYDLYLALGTPWGYLYCLDTQLRFAAPGAVVPAARNLSSMQLHSVPFLDITLPPLSHGQYHWYLVCTPPGASPMYTGNWLLFRSASMTIGY